MSKTSPKGGKRGCLCENGTYHKDCCKGELINQGIGSDQSNAQSTITKVDTQRVITNNN